jgi:hypothetical protein
MEEPPPELEKIAENTEGFLQKHPIFRVRE